MYTLESLTPLQRHWIFANSNIPRRFLGMEPKDFSNGFPEEIDQWISQVLEGNVIKKIGGLGTTGVGLLFDGVPGLGKTTHAVVAAMEFVRRLPEDNAKIAEVLSVKDEIVGRSLHPIYYMTFPEFLSRKKALIEADSDSKKEIYREMEGLHGRAKEDHLNVRVLILDDLGKEYKGGGFNDASFDEVLRSRYDKGLPTIITTNVARDKWALQYGEAMGSFAFEAFQKVTLVGKDQRKG
jgi:DNA replication protein DnaC